RAARRSDLPPRAVLRVLVGPEAQEPSPVPEAVALELVVAHLDDELRPDGVPVELPALRPAALAAGDPLVAQLPLRDHLRKLLLELAPYRRRKPRAMAHEIELTLVAVEPEQERGNSPVGLVAPAEPDDHAIRRLVRLHLDHAVARAGQVGDVQPFRHDPVEPGLGEPP